jgi:hypothetical protein
MASRGIALAPRRVVTSMVLLATAIGLTAFAPEIPIQYAERLIVAHWAPEQGHHYPIIAYQAAHSISARAH